MNTLTKKPKILIIGGNGVRHLALSGYLISQGFDIETYVVEVQNAIYSKSTFSRLLKNHYENFLKVEHDYFVKYSKKVLKYETFDISEINNICTINRAIESKPDYIVTFGCPILSDTWISSFKDRIIGIHLGLSPYYRGSGTNFWPIHNDEFWALGFTLMKLDKGIDSGPILHQQRPQLQIDDSIHTIGCNIIESSFEALINLLLIQNLEFLIRETTYGSHNKIKSKIYFKKDFDEKALFKALKNLTPESINKYLVNEKKLTDLNPIISLGI